MSEVVEAKQPCGDCGSSDALHVYDDGHTHCFSCDTTRQPKGGAVPDAEAKTKSKDRKLIRNGDVVALRKRKLKEETCVKFGYEVGEFNGKTVQIAPYHNARGQTVAQKVRFANKDFTVRGDLGEAVLFGQTKWKQQGKRVVITEGEIDALSYAQATNLSWPVVSVPNGAQGAKKSIANQIEWLEGFEEVVFMFDMDEQGQDAAEECATLLSPGRAKIATLPLKDASEMLVEGRTKELQVAVYDAKEFRPDGIVTLDAIRDAVLTPVEWGDPWPWDTLTEITYGRRRGEVYMFGAGTGVGKTDAFTETIAQTIKPVSAGGLSQKAAAFYLEQPKVETGKRVAGKIAGRRFHVPDAGWTQDELMAVLDDTEVTRRLYLYDHFGETDWDVIKTRVRYLAQAEGIQHFFIDHLTAMADPSDEKASLEQLMKEVASLAQALGITIYMISHLSTPDGTPHEEGGRVFIRHFKGSRAIGFWSHFMFALERDTQADDEVERHTTTFRVLKDRLTGQATGQTFPLKYEAETGGLVEGVPVEAKDEFDDDDDDVAGNDF